MKKTLIILALLAISCGSRKVQKSEIKEQIKDKTEITNKIETNTNIKTDTDIEETVITPIDTAKAMVIDGKEYRNTKIRHVKTKKAQVVNEKKIEAKKQVNNVVVKKDTQIKNIEKEPSYWWWWIPILILIILYLLYRFYKPF